MYATRDRRTRTTSRLIGGLSVHADEHGTPDAPEVRVLHHWEGRAFGALVLAAFPLYGVGSALGNTPLGTTLVALNSVAVATIGALGFRLLRSDHPSAAAAYAGARVTEAALLLGGTVLLQITGLRDADTIGYQLGMLVLGAGSVPFFHAIGNTRLLPSWFARWGVAGYGILAAGAALELTTGRPVATYLAVPGGLFEVALGLHLLRGGFGPSQ